MPTLLTSLLIAASLGGARSDLSDWRTTLRIAEARLEQLASSAESLSASQLDRWIGRTREELSSLHRQLEQVEIERREIEGLRRFEPDWRFLLRESESLGEVRTGGELAQHLDAIAAELAQWRFEAEWMDRLPPMRSADQARGVAESVLTEGEYELDVRSSPARWGGRLDGLRRFLDGLFDLLRRSSGRVRAAWTQLLASVLTFGAGLFVAVLVLRALGDRLRSGSAVEVGEVAVRQRPPQLLRAGDRARRMRDGRDAVACYFRMAVATCAERGWLERRPAATCADYAAELAGRSQAVAEAFSELSRVFESVTYGGVEPDAEGVERFRHQALGIGTAEARG